MDDLFCRRYRQGPFVCASYWVAYLAREYQRFLHGESFEVTSFARRQDPQRKGGGITNHLGRIVDLGLLSQIPMS
jgi:hypothetical protein